MSIEFALDPHNSFDFIVQLLWANCGKSKTTKRITFTNNNDETSSLEALW